MMAMPAAGQEAAEHAPAGETPAATEPGPATEASPPTEPKPVPVDDAQRSICLLLESAARANGLPVEFFARVIWQESRFRADAVGPVTRNGQRARGIAQFMPDTAAERNLLNPFDPIQALPKSAEFLRELRNTFGNLGLAAAAYNAGPRRVREWLDGTGPMPAETRNYVQAITGASVDEWAKAKDGRDADRKQQSGRDCGTLVALLKRAPSPFIDELERRVATGAMQPWGVILSSGFSRPKILATYASIERRHAGVLAGLDPTILQTKLLTRGPRPFYQVRIGAPSRVAADNICNRIRHNKGACMVLHNPRRG